MMLTAALFLISPAPVVLPTPADATLDEEIVVLARRLDEVSFEVGQDPKGRWHCSMDRTTGNPKLDSRMCKEVTDCVRKRGTEETQIRACVSGTKEKVLARFKKAMAKRK